jgi:hypothetical protein
LLVERKPKTPNKIVGYALDIRHEYLRQFTGISHARTCSRKVGHA